MNMNLMLLKYKNIITQIFAVIFLTINIVSSPKPYSYGIQNINLEPDDENTEEPASDFPEFTELEIDCYNKIMSVFKKPENTEEPSLRAIMMFAFSNLTTSIVQDLDNKPAWNYYYFLGKGIKPGVDFLCPRDWCERHLKGSDVQNTIENTYGKKKKKILKNAFFNVALINNDPNDSTYWKIREYHYHVVATYDLIHDDSILNPRSFCRMTYRG